MDKVDVVASVLPFCDVQTFLAVTATCSHAHEARLSPPPHVQAAVRRLRQLLPADLLACAPMRSWLQVPEIDLGDQEGHTDYLDFVHQQALPDGHDLAFGAYRHGRGFLAMRSPGSEYCAVFFQRYSDVRRHWCAARWPEVQPLNVYFGRPSADRDLLPVWFRLACLLSR
jgi:hypothetical protein